jgi:hypothetical protein
MFFIGPSARLGLTDGGCDSEFAWAEERLPAIDVSAEAIPQLDILD